MPPREIIRRKPWERKKYIDLPGDRICMLFNKGHAMNDCAK